MAWSHRNLLDVDVLTREDLETLLDQAMHMEDLMDRPVKKVPALRGKLVDHRLRQLLVRFGQQPEPYFHHRRHDPRNRVADRRRRHQFRPRPLRYDRNVFRPA